MTQREFSCGEIREGLTEYLESALPPDKRQGYEDHFAGCRACRLVLDQLRFTIAAVRRLPPEGPPPGLKDRITRQLIDRDEP